MKKLTVLAGVLCFVFVSCCNKAEETPTEEKQCANEEQHDKCKMTDEQKAECEAFCKQWADWANLSEDTKKELVAKKKAHIDQQYAEMEAKLAACKEEWATFDNLSLDEQKALIDKRMNCGKKCCKDKKECQKKCEGKEGEKK